MNARQAGECVSPSAWLPSCNCLATFAYSSSRMSSSRSHISLDRLSGRPIYRAYQVEQLCARQRVVYIGVTRFGDA
jgi:hypothetical protein